MLILGGGQSAQAAECPIAKYTTDVKKVNTIWDRYGETIYFCKQKFTSDQLTLQPDEAQLLTGGSRAISMSNTVQSFPLTNTVNLSGFTPSQLNLNTLSANFPNSGGKYSFQSLFNFYSLIRYDGLGTTGTCYSFNGDNQFNLITDYLRENANIFQANPNGSSIVQTGVRSDMNNDLAVIEDVIIGHDIQTNSPLLADITFYHANADEAGQWFSTTLNRRFCWVGVSTRMDIKTDTNPPKYSGDYVVDVGVLTQ